ncbi:MAG: hypothetical protein FWE24_09015 [Defluviitaleaceae bacterium]|nr:hypothetical protein [Defluviitaleaceae bacterium]
MERDWDILLIGGASGTGKTSISLPLARHYGIDLVRVDDFQMMLGAVTTPVTHPAIHYWKTHPNWQDEGAEATVRQLIDVGKLLTPGLKAVIDDHIIENIPMVLEGDFILPELAVSFENPKIKTVFIHEPSKEQILQNFLAREGTVQEYRADVSYQYGKRLVQECDKYDIITVESRPWDTLMGRVIKAIK